MTRCRGIVAAVAGIIIGVVFGGFIAAGSLTAAEPELPFTAFRSFRPAERYNRQFAEIGVRLVHVYPANTLCSLGIPYTQYPPNWTGPNQYDWKALDRHLDDVSTWNPGAKLICMIDLNTPPWWIASHDGADSFRQLGKVAPRDDYRRDAEAYLTAFLTHTEGKYRDRIAAYMLSGGMTCEWQDVSRGEPSPAKTDAFRRWSGRADASIPASRMQASRSPFFDPERDAEAVAYWRFSADLVAGTLLDFAAAAQRTIRHRVPLGAFFGYTLEHSTNRLLYEGHLSFDRVFASPDLDFFSCPASYRDRGPGGTSGFMYCVDSLPLHRKHGWLEVDHITHLRDGSQDGRPIPGRTDRTRSEAETTGVLRREFAMGLTHGMRLWWFDMFGGWFDNPAVMKEIERMRRISDRPELQAGVTTAEIAVLVDADSMYYVDGRSPLSDRVLSAQRGELARLGAPFAIHSLADLPKLDLSRVKLVVLPNLFAVTKEKEELLRRKVFCDGRRVVWNYAPGIIRDGRYDPKHVERLTGISLTEAPKLDAPNRVERKTHDGWTSILVTRPPIPSAVLRSLAREAGVHIYSDAADVCYANGSLLAIHTGTGGERRFRLPEPCRVVELFSGRVVADQPVREFLDTLPKHATHLYHLTP